MSIFHAYDVRGIYPGEISEQTAYRVGWAYARFLLGDQKLQLPLKVVLGMDMRGSSPFLAREVTRGITDQGIDVVEVGRVPTPAFYYAIAFHDFAGGIMVTASHNPKEYNGFKFCLAKAAPVGLGSGLEKIQADFDSAETDEYKRGTSRGKLSSLEGMTRAYVRKDLSYLNPGKIQKFKIAADTANAMGATYLEELFKTVPVDPIKVNWELNGNMPVHQADPLKLENLQQIKAIIKNEQADLGIATDGDGDRIVFLDEKAEVIPSAIIAGLIARELLKKYPGAKIGMDLRQSWVTRDMILAAGGEPVETMVGHSLIKKLMREKDVLFSGELSSHYYFRENFNFESPIFVAAMLLTIRSELGKPFSEIWEPYSKKYHHSGEINFTAEDKTGIMALLAKKYADGTVSKLDGVKVSYEDWWFNVRPSNTEPLLRLNLEAKTEDMMKQKVEEISQIIKAK